MKLIVKYFFLADILLLEIYLTFGYIHFSLGICVLFGGGCLRLELSCVRVKAVVKEGRSESENDNWSFHYVCMYHLKLL